MLKAVLLAIAIAAMPCLSAAANTTAKVEQGLLQGTMEEGLTVYRGIPFAAPPTGDLRWRSPQPAVPGKVFAIADKFAPECVQRSGPASRLDERGLPLSECMDAGKVGFGPCPCSGLDLWRRLQRRRHLRSHLQRRSSGTKGRGAGQHRATGWERLGFWLIQS